MHNLSYDSMYLKFYLIRGRGNHPANSIEENIHHQIELSRRQEQGRLDNLGAGHISIACYPPSKQIEPIGILGPLHVVHTGPCLIAPSTR